MNYPVNDKITKALLSAAWPRESTTLALNMYDNHHAIWIDNYTYYNTIEQRLSALDYSRAHVVIFQHEECWFENCEYDQVRNSIKQHPRWTDQSFIITHSRQDKARTLDLGINVVCRPGLFDLILYKPYDINSVSINNISFHTGVCWARPEYNRLKLWNILKQAGNKVNVAKIGNNWNHDFVVNNNPEPIVESTGPQNIEAPYSQIAADLCWHKYIAFGTVIESWHRDIVPNANSRFKTIIPKNRLLNFTPTTSEKIYRNMHLLRPAVIHGGRNTRDYLLALGFDTWDWFVDWSFDSEPNDRIRFDKFLAEVKRLLNTPLDDLIRLINKNQDRLLYNRDRLFWLINNYDTIDI